MLIGCVKPLLENSINKRNCSIFVLYICCKVYRCFRCSIYIVAKNRTHWTLSAQGNLKIEMLPWRLVKVLLSEAKRKYTIRIMWQERSHFYRDMISNIPYRFTSKFITKIQVSYAMIIVVTWRVTVLVEWFRSDLSRSSLDSVTSTSDFAIQFFIGFKKVSGPNQSVLRRPT